MTCPAYGHPYTGLLQPAVRPGHVLLGTAVLFYRLTQLRKPVKHYCRAEALASKSNMKPVPPRHSTSSWCASYAKTQKNRSLTLARPHASSWAACAPTQPSRSTSRRTKRSVLRPAARASLRRPIRCPVRPLCARDVGDRRRAPPAARRPSSEPCACGAFKGRAQWRSRPRVCAGTGAALRRLNRLQCDDGPHSARC